MLNKDSLNLFNFMNMLKNGHNCDFMIYHNKNYEFS